eukprot:gene4648-5090_t
MAMMWLIWLTWSWFFVFSFEIEISTSKNINQLVKNRFQSADLVKALQFLHGIQHPVNCSGPYTVVTIGLRGGFAAQFQLAAAEWMRALSGLNFESPVLIQGRLMGYSDGHECQHVNHDWTCFFNPPSQCHDELLARGQKVDVKRYPANDDEAVPSAFSTQGQAFWWGAIQLYLFNVRPFVEEYIYRQISLMHRGRGFTLGLPMAGMHVRHGDKHVDGFRDHSLSEEIALITPSKDCMLKNHCDQCFLYVEDHREIAILRGHRHQTCFLRANEIDSHNSSLFDVVAMNHSANILHDFLHHTKSMVVHNKMAHGPHSVVMPLPVFVASDDQEVLRSAFVLGFITSLPYQPESTQVGVSQTTASQGMLKHLLSHPEHGYNATLEIIMDIFMLSRSSTLIGLCASQVFRMAVAMANASHALHYVAIADADQVGRVQQLSRKYYVPFPEDFLHSPQRKSKDT